MADDELAESADDTEAPADTTGVSRRRMLGGAVLAGLTGTAVGAVGGPARNFTPDGQAYPVRSREPVGRLTCYGRTLGNMHDHPETWRSRPPRAADHLAGANLSFRRRALASFEAGLRGYSQSFELVDICVRSKVPCWRP